eukprot:1660867-Pyramimonas_sp.AAC.1
MPVWLSLAVVGGVQKPQCLIGDFNVLIIRNAPARRSNACCHPPFVCYSVSEVVVGQAVLAQAAVVARAVVARARAADLNCSRQSIFACRRGGRPPSLT